jgi:thiol-disulfide isomerase/thioredoxin
MSTFLIIIIVVIVLFISLQLYIFLKSKKSIGKPIPFDILDDGIVDKMKDKKGLIYFQSPSCHNCKNVTPIIDELTTERDNIISIDASKDAETSRAFSIMGTPSFIFFSNNNIANYFVGAKSKDFLIEKLNKL